MDFDTQIAAYLVNAALRAQKIADVVGERLDLVLPPAAAGLPPVATAGLEALSSLAVRPSLEQALRDEGVDRLFAEVELPLIPILARMEAAGIAIDRAALAELEREFAAEISRFEAEIYAAVGHEFTIGSPKQLGDILFVELGLPKGRRTKTGYSTDASVLEELRGVHPAIEPILEWRIYTEAPLDLRRGAADADRARTAACTRCSTRPWRRPDGCRRRTPTSRTSRSGRRSAGASGTPSSPARPTRRWSPPTTARSSSGSSPTCPATSTSPTRSRARPTSTARPRPACSARTPRTSPPTSGRWPRWSTSGSRTG